MGKLNDWLGVVTNVGLIAGLLLVAYEVNQTNLAMERDYQAWGTSTQLDVQQMFVDWGGSIADRDTAELWWKGINDEELDAVDQERFYQISENYFWAYRSAGFAWKEIDGGGGGFARGLAQRMIERPGLSKRFDQWHSESGGEFSRLVLAFLEPDRTTDPTAPGR